MSIRLIGFPLLMISAALAACSSSTGGNFVAAPAASPVSLIAPANAPAYTSDNVATPPPGGRTDEVYLAEGTTGIGIFNTKGQGLNTLAIDSSALGLDDRGNIYNLYVSNPTPAPGASTAPSPSASLQFFRRGSTTPRYTYQLPGLVSFVETSAHGELAAFTFTGDGQGFATTTAYVWRRGDRGGPPDYTLSATEFGTTVYDVDRDGTIYIGGLTASNTYAISEYLPGSSKPWRTVPETIVPQGQQQYFAGNYMAVDRDGTIYLTEYSFVCNDPLAGLYIYPRHGPEKFVPTYGANSPQGAGPAGVDVDDAGNIYVANNNGCLDPNNGYAPVADALHEIDVLAPGGASIKQQITGNFDPYPLVTATDGTIVFSSFPFAAGVAGVTGSFVIPPEGAAQQFSTVANTEIALYDARTGRHHRSGQSIRTSLARSQSGAFASMVRLSPHTR